MMYAFMKHLYGTDNLDQVMNLIEYAPHLDPHWDPFSVVHKVSCFHILRRHVLREDSRSLERI